MCASIPQNIYYIFRFCVKNKITFCGLEKILVRIMKLVTSWRYFYPAQSLPQYIIMRFYGDYFTCVNILHLVDSILCNHCLSNCRTFHTVNERMKIHLIYETLICASLMDMTTKRCIYFNEMILNVNAITAIFTVVFERLVFHYWIGITRFNTRRCLFLIFRIFYWICKEMPLLGK